MISYHWRSSTVHFVVHYRPTWLKTIYFLWLVYYDNISLNLSFFSSCIRPVLVDRGDVLLAVWSVNVLNYILMLLIRSISPPMPHWQCGVDFDTYLGIDVTDTETIAIRTNKSVMNDWIGTSSNIILNLTFIIVNALENCSVFENNTFVMIKKIGQIN